jgi:flagellar basal body-associated protein FliL
VGTTTVIIIVVAVVLVVAVVGGAVSTKQRSTRAADGSPATKRAPRPEPPPMRGLEDALNQVTDRSGTTMAARLDAEGAHVDDLRDVDDTGPLLRRALDHVTPRDNDPVDPAIAASAVDDAERHDPADEPGTPGPATT